MKIKAVGVKGFRGYSEEIQVQISDLLVLVGKNDVGKSTILEALDIFFNEGKGCVKLDKEDINKANLAAGDEDIEIWVEFEEFPESIVLDASNETAFADEYLLTQNNTLQVIKRYPKAGKEKVYISAHHPTAEGCADLLQMKQPALQKIVSERSLECADRTKNAELRKSIWAAEENLALGTVEIEIAKIDAKDLWAQLKKYMPLYTLFQADRKNSDGDSEVQDPMKLAVKEILATSSIQEDLTRIATTVKERLDEVAAKTWEKLQRMNEGIASSLSPVIPDASDLKWNDVFKNVMISGDDDIPINKRGRGVKRLVLISFFQAEAERRKLKEGLPSVVYAIEEPETSQHPDHQRALIEALKILSRASQTQILLTTHSPEVVKQLEFKNLCHIAGQAPEDIKPVRERELPYPSLNEVNFAAFDEASHEYHNELYGYIEAEGELSNFQPRQSTKSYVRQRGTNLAPPRMISLSEFIRHQIHHPENTHNTRFTNEELSQSIEDMRRFVKIYRSNLP